MKILASNLKSNRMYAYNVYHCTPTFPMCGCRGGGTVSILAASFLSVFISFSMFSVTTAQEKEVRLLCSQLGRKAKRYIRLQGSGQFFSSHELNRMSTLVQFHFPSSQCTVYVCSQLHISLIMPGLRKSEKNMSSNLKSLLWTRWTRILTWNWGMGRDLMLRFFWCFRWEIFKIDSQFFIENRLIF